MFLDKHNNYFYTNDAYNRYTWQPELEARFWYVANGCHVEFKNIWMYGLFCVFEYQL